VTTEPAGEILAWQNRFEKVLDEYLPGPEEAPRELHQAMRYSALAAGKRFRPILVFATGKAFDVPLAQLDPIAASIELIHAYSLIHDDLPAMDDDDLRRGRPTCHKQFDEATAILAGDALQALAFEVLAGGLPAESAFSLRVIHEISGACGSVGMAGGQAMDLAAVGKSISEESLVRMHRLKTGALIRACVTAPCLLIDAGQQALGHMASYGECVGLAFQVHDDILDVTGNSERIGKSTLADAALNKPTFPSILGMENSRKKARELRDEAMSHLQDIQGDTSNFVWLANYVIDRDR
jgi:farnesyl diphosphate synthase/geranylgeranyl diphosphate synthase type II